MIPSSSSSYSVAGTLIPGLPDDISALILLSLPYSHRSRLRPTSRAWHSFFSSSSLTSLRRLLRLPPLHILCIFPSDPSLIPPFLFDPATSAWSPLPLIPCSPFLYGLYDFAALSLGPHLYVLGGSQFDARSYPLGLPIPSPAVHRLSLSPSPSSSSWIRLPDMLSPRGSFACAPIPGSNSIVVAGGGSRHAMFPSGGGTRMSSAEVFDADSSEWAPASRLPRYRSGCVGFFLRERGHEEEEFWVMGGYGDYRPVAGVVPANVFYRDAVVLGLRSGKWREVGDMWEAWERQKLGKVVVMEGVDGELMGVYMLDHNVIFRYDFASNRWQKESGLRRKVLSEDSCAFVAMNGELCVLTKAMPFFVEPSRALRKSSTIQIQAYEPLRRRWRFFTTNPPFDHQIDFKTAVSCTIQL